MTKYEEDPEMQITEKFMKVCLGLVLAYVDVLILIYLYMEVYTYVNPIK